VPSQPIGKNESPTPNPSIVTPKPQGLNGLPTSVKYDVPDITPTTP